MRAATTVLVVVSLGVLAGCSAAEPGIPVGTCLAETIGEDADFTSVVECDEPHRYDVVGTALWPEMEERISLDGAEEVYDDISALRLDAYWNWTDDACQALFRQSQDLDELVVEGKSGDDLNLNPIGTFFIDASLPAREAFLDGDTTTLCSIGWLDAEGERTALSFPSGVDIGGFVTGDIGVVDAYSCFDRRGQDDQSAIPCSEPHNGEYLVVFDGAVALDPAWIASLDPESLGADDYTELDEVCAPLLNAVHPGLLDDPGWIVWGDHLRNFGGGWTDFDGTVDLDQRYMFYCGVLRSDDSTVTGSVVIGDLTEG